MSVNWNFAITVFLTFPQMGISFYFKIGWRWLLQPHWRQYIVCPIPPKERMLKVLSKFSAAKLWFKSRARSGNWFAMLGCPMGLFSVKLKFGAFAGMVGPCIHFWRMMQHQRNCSVKKLIHNSRLWCILGNILLINRRWIKGDFCTFSKSVNIACSSKTHFWKIFDIHSDIDVYQTGEKQILLRNEDQSVRKI